MYSYDKGFTKRWRQLIMDELSRRGIEAEIGKLTFDPFEGLVARKVSIFEDEDHQNILATINNLTLDIDFARLVRKEQFLNTIDLRDADISFPIDPTQPEGERIEIENFSARLQMPDDTIDIQKAEFEIGGLIVNLRGALLQPSPNSASPRRDPLETRKQRQAINAAIREIEKFYVTGTKPRLEIELFGDLDEPAGIEATLELRATDVTRRNYSCDRLEADIEIKYPEIHLNRLLIADSYGELHGHADYSIGSDRVSFDLESSIDSHTLLRSILDTRQFGEVVFYDPPRLRMEGDYFIREKAEPGSLPLRAFGNAACGQFISRGEMFEGFHADFSIDHERLFARNIYLEHKSGTAEAKILFSGEDGMRFSATAELNPKIFSLFIDNEAAKSMIERFEFGRTSTFFIELAGHGPARDRRTWQTEGRVSASNFSYNRIPVQHVLTKFSASDKVLTFDSFRLDNDKGSISGDVARIDTGAGIATVSGVAGTIDPVLTTAYFAPKVSKHLERYRFAKPPALTLEGDLALKGAVGNDFTVTFKSPGEASYTFLKKALPLSAPDGTAKIVGSKLNLELDSKLFDGEVDVVGNFNLAKDQRAFDAKVSVDGIDFSQLAQTYEIKTKSQGTFTGRAVLTGQIGSLESIEADGAAIIYNGNVFSIPVLGPLSKLINVMMPKDSKAGYSIASEASARLRLQGGVLRADDFQAVAGGFKLKGDGDVDLIADDIDFNVEMNLRGAPGVVLYPVSRLFKYKGEGSMQAPVWRPVNFSLPRGEGPALLGGPGINPRDGDADDAGRGNLLENGIPIVSPIGRGLVRGVKKGGEAIINTGEKILGTGDRSKAAEQETEDPPKETLLTEP